jgi:hypothetical protein
MSVQNLNKYLTQGAIEGFITFAAPLQAFSYVVKPGVSAVNDVIRVPYATNTSASATFTYANGYTTDSNLIVGKPVTMDQLLYQKISLTDSDLSLLNPEALIAIGRQAGTRLAVDVVSASLANVITVANFGNSGSYGAPSLSHSLGLGDIDLRANTYNWPVGQRSLLLTPTAQNYLLQNSSINTAANFGSDDPIRGASIKSVVGFTPYLCNFALPLADQAIALNANGVLVGIGYHAPQDSGQAYVDVRQLQDTQTNLSIGFRQYYDAAKATNIRVFDCLFGSGKGADNAVWHLKA